MGLRPDTQASSEISVFISAQGENAVMSAYQEILDAWPVDYDELMVPTAFGETHVIASGPEEAPPVVMLHALFATATSWYRNVEALSRSYRIYCVDVIGEANKSRPTQPITSLDDYLRWFTELIDGLGIDSLYLVGNSYGGFTAAYYAMKLPERIRKLVLIGPAATIHSMRPFMLHMFLPKGLFLLLPWLPGASGAARHGIDWMRAGLSSDRLWDRLFYQTMRHGKLINRVFPRVYAQEELAGIAGAVLLMFGERELVYGDLGAAIRSGRELIPEAKLAIIPDAHHVAAVSNPDAANEELLGFLADGPSTG
jgi:pimeloyl-ACP methyl ester carboxylesterase